MAVIMETPQIISLLYQQERSDLDYGSCSWARFYFDLKNYTLSIESDCGNFSYGWYPTPDTESFLKLCSRLEDEYLLSKISDRTIVDREKTWTLIKELVSETIEYHDLEDVLDDYEMSRIEDACSYRNPSDVGHALIEIFNENSLGEYIDNTYEIWERICMTYHPNAKRIAEVFVKHIQPFIKANLL